MPLVVEDGTGLADAESYASVAEFDAYCAENGHDITGKTTEQKEQALRRATRWIDVTYAARFIGRFYVYAQGLEWPRLDALYRLQYLPLAPLPRQLKDATCEAAVRELNEPGSLSPDVTTGKIAKREKLGPIEVEYAVGAGNAASQTPVISIIDGILAALLNSGRSSYSGKAVRG